MKKIKPHKSIAVIENYAVHEVEDGTKEEDKHGNAILPQTHSLIFQLFSTWQPLSACRIQGLMEGS